jgi:dolichyl-phosphate beta-glucosyltransferase
MPVLSFIIPAFNEEKRLGISLRKAREYFMQQSYSVEIIIVNDGSADATKRVMEEQQAVFAERKIPFHTLEQPRNMGKGAAVRRGMLEATGEYRIFADADFSTPVHETARVLERLYAGADVCIGSRGVDKSLVRKHQPFYREALGNIVNVLVQAAFIPGIRDTQCGFKGFTAKAANVIFSRARLDGWMFDLEALYIASRLGLRIDEIPVEWYNDERSTVSLWHSFQILRDLASIKQLHRDL